MSETSVAVLLIDDQPSEYIHLKAVLEAKPLIVPGIILHYASTFQGGLEILRNVNPSVVLRDLKLSEEMKGVATLEAMRESLSDEAPVIIITGAIDPTDEWNLPDLWRVAISNGAMGFLRKDRYISTNFRSFLLHEMQNAILHFNTRKLLGIRFKLGNVPA